MMESTPDPVQSYGELLDVDPPDAGPPLIERPVRVVAAERFPVDQRTPDRFVLGTTHVEFDKPTLIVGDHPARTRLQVLATTGPGGYSWVYSHSAETCTPNSGTFSVPVITARGELWAYAWYPGGASPAPGDYFVIHWAQEFTN